MRAVHIYYATILLGCSVGFLGLIPGVLWGHQWAPTIGFIAFFVALIGAFVYRIARRI